jgi:hypothetical protein
MQLSAQKIATVLQENVIRAMVMAVKAMCKYCGAVFDWDSNPYLPIFFLKIREYNF